MAQAKPLAKVPVGLPRERMREALVVAPPRDDALPPEAVKWDKVGLDARLRTCTGLGCAASHGFTIFLFISPGMDGNRAPKMKRCEE